MGHGHVIPNKDGSKARCGGPPFCRVCQMELSHSSLVPSYPVACDHIVGVSRTHVGHLLRLSEVAERADLLRQQFMCDVADGVLSVSEVQAKKDWTSLLHLKDAYSMFSYCPECGDQIHRLRIMFLCRRADTP